MPAPYSYDLRKKAVNAVKRGEKKIVICRLMRISRNTLNLWLQREKETGDYSAIANRPPRENRKIQDLERFKQFVKQHQDKTQQQMADLWGENLTQQNISDGMEKLGITRKKTYGYQERDEEKRKQFKEKLHQKSSNHLVYIDEAGFDNRDDYPYGYSPKGERCYALKSGKRNERVSWIAALKKGKVFAPLTFEGSCNRDLFETWLEKSLIPQLQPGDIIIIDNATFHKGQSIQEIVSEAGCEIWYLPPYSPDLNKIERWWSVLKTWMKQRVKEFETIRECVDAAFKKCPNVYA
ncbi:IS630 family transposase [Myxosarcina sp. GI1]|uniref:IS630 family transposase n=1 Tax=Myxosarcina sp. GI1 TaxID=1541065 RepID=UPI001C0FAD59|nr:IS630 family transposase [Myxosarcina sp. GI1]